MKRMIVAAGVAIALVSSLGVAAWMNFKVGALPEPGHLETALATRARRYFIRRSSARGIPSPPANGQEGIEEGDKLYGTECATCHGLDGSKLTDAGRWMYPRASRLVSSDVQSYSDRELFWIVKNGIRLSGMPAFGEVESDEHIWNLVWFLRTLPRSPDRSNDGSDH